MKLQYVFGNPTGRPKAKAKRKTSVKAKKRRKKVAKKTKRKKNPRKSTVKAYEPIRMKNMKTGKVTKKKGKRAAQYSTKEVATKAELHRYRAKLSLARAAIADAIIAKKQASSKAAKSRIGRMIVAARKKYNKLSKSYKAKAKVTKSELNAFDGMVKQLKETGAIVKTETTYTKGAGVAKKKRKKKTTRRKTKRKKKTTKRKVVRKKKRKKKASKKKTTRRKTKRKVVRKKAKKKTTRKKARKKTSRKKRRTSAVKVTGVKGNTITVRKKAKKRKSTKRRSRRRKNPFFGGTVMKKSNPMKVAGMKVAGYDPIELGELVTGGALYGIANSFFAPMMARLPVIGAAAGMLGGTVPSLIAGIGLNMLSETKMGKNFKLGGINVLEFAGDGLLGAAVVGAGVALGQQFLPAIGLAGVDYIPAGSGDPDYGGVDYTPDGGMMGVDFVPGASLPGQNPDADFGKSAYEESSADFGGVPEGMGMG